MRKKFPANFTINGHTIGPTPKFNLKVIEFFYKTIKGADSIICICEVVDGHLKKKDEISIAMPGKTETILEKIQEIQIEDNCALFAEKGEKIGIRLFNTTLKKLKDFNTPIPNENPNNSNIGIHQSIN